MPRYSRLPRTLDDDNETSWPVPRMYVTRNELGMILIGTMVLVMVSLIFTRGMSPWQVPLGLVCLFGMANWVRYQKEKRNRVKSWLYDWYLECGLLMPGRALMNTRRRQLLSGHTVAAPSSFAAGSRKRGYDIGISHPWQRHHPPTLPWRPLLPARIVREFNLQVRAPAPDWWILSERAEKKVRLTMIGQVVEVVTPWSPKLRDPR